MNEARRGKRWAMLLRMCGALLVCILAGILLMTAVYAIPVSAMDEHMRQSTQTLSEEGLYPHLSPYATSRLDNWTDAAMLIIAGNEGEGTVLERAMTCERSLLDNYQPVESLEARYQRGEELPQHISYARYWHGYLLLLKPLLLVTDYSGIRLLNQAAQLLLNAAILIFLYKREMKRLMLPWVLTIGFLMPAALGKCLQYSSCFYGFALGVLLLLLFWERWDVQRACFLFLGLGIFVAFLDLLSYPVAVFGIPAAVWICMKPDKRWIEGVKRLVMIGASWCFGYGGMWAGKWVVGTLLTDENVIQEALSALIMRTSDRAEETQYSAVSAICKNGKAFLKTPVSIAACLFVGILVIWIFLRLKKGGHIAVGFAVPMTLLCLLPFLWYSVTVNHSTVHYFFANKTLAVTAFAGMCLLVQTVWQMQMEYKNKNMGV